MEVRILPREYAGECRYENTFTLLSDSGHTPPHPREPASVFSSRQSCRRFEKPNMTHEANADREYIGFALTVRIRNRDTAARPSKQHPTRQQTRCEPLITLVASPTHGGECRWNFISKEIEVVGSNPTCSNKASDGIAGMCPQIRTTQPGAVAQWQSA